MHPFCPPIRAAVGGSSSSSNSITSAQRQQHAAARQRRGSGSNSGANAVISYHPSVHSHLSLPGGVSSIGIISPSVSQHSGHVSAGSLNHASMPTGSASATTMARRHSQRSTAADGGMHGARHSPLIAAAPAAASPLSNPLESLQRRAAALGIISSSSHDTAPSNTSSYAYPASVTSPWHHVAPPALPPAVAILPHSTSSVPRVLLSSSTSGASSSSSASTTAAAAAARSQHAATTLSRAPRDDSTRRASQSSSLTAASLLQSASSSPIPPPVYFASTGTFRGEDVHHSSNSSFNQQLNLIKDRLREQRRSALQATAQASAALESANAEWHSTQNAASDIDSDWRDAVQPDPSYASILRPASTSSSSYFQSTSFPVSSSIFEAPRSHHSTLTSSTLQLRASTASLLAAVAAGEVSSGAAPVSVGNLSSSPSPQPPRSRSNRKGSKQQSYSLLRRQSTWSRSSSSSSSAPSASVSEDENESQQHVNSHDLDEIKMSSASSKPVDHAGHNASIRKHMECRSHHHHQRPPPHHQSRPVQPIAQHTSAAPSPSLSPAPQLSANQSTASELHLLPASSSTLVAIPPSTAPAHSARASPRHAPSPCTSAHPSSNSSSASSTSIPLTSSTTRSPSLFSAPQSGTHFLMASAHPSHIPVVPSYLEPLYQCPDRAALVRRLKALDEQKLQRQQQLGCTVVYDSIDPNPEHAHSNSNLNCNQSDANAIKHPAGANPWLSPLPGELVPYYIPTSTDDTTLVFESRFESGNLRRAIQVDTFEYDLLIRPDINTNTWFYFSIRNTRAAHPSPSSFNSSSNGTIAYHFNIVNYTKSDSLYNAGMQPLFYSQLKSRDSLLKNKHVPYQHHPPYTASASSSSHHQSGSTSHPVDDDNADVQFLPPTSHGAIGWYRGGWDIAYYRDRQRGGRTNSNYTLSFCIEFEYDNDTVYIAYAYPYTITQLYRTLDDYAEVQLRRRAQILLVRSLCKTLAGNDVPLLIISDFTATPQEIAKRPTIIFTARVHPGETNASWMMQGVMDLLLALPPTASESSSSSSPLTAFHASSAAQLRKQFVFYLIPCLNPDGVIGGNYRCSLAGVDLNRQWAHPDRAMHPTIAKTKQLIAHIQARQLAPWKQPNAFSNAQQRANQTGSPIFPSPSPSPSPSHSLDNSPLIPDVVAAIDSPEHKSASVISAVGGVQGGGSSVASMAPFHRAAVADSSPPPQNGPVLMFCDLHGHSRAQNVFIYGVSSEGANGANASSNAALQQQESPAPSGTPSPTNKLASWYPSQPSGLSMLSLPRSASEGLPSSSSHPSDGCLSSLCPSSLRPHRLSERIFARLLATRSPFFNYDGCHFAVRKGKESTARVVVAREFAITNSFTVEASFGGVAASEDGAATTSTTTAGGGGAVLNSSATLAAAAAAISAAAQASAAAAAIACGDSPTFGPSYLFSASSATSPPALSLSAASCFAANSSPLHSSKYRGHAFNTRMYEEMGWNLCQALLDQLQPQLYLQAGAELDVLYPPQPTQSKSSPHAQGSDAPAEDSDDDDPSGGGAAVVAAPEIVPRKRRKKIVKKKATSSILHTTGNNPNLLPSRELASSLGSNVVGATASSISATNSNAAPLRLKTSKSLARIKSADRGKPDSRQQHVRAVISKLAAVSTLDDAADAEQSPALPPLPYESGRGTEFEADESAASAHAAAAHSAGHHPLVRDRLHSTSLARIQLPVGHAAQLHFAAASSSAASTTRATPSLPLFPPHDARAATLSSSLPSSPAATQTHFSREELFRLATSVPAPAANPLKQEHRASGFVRAEKSTGIDAAALASKLKKAKKKKIKKEI